MGAMSDGPEDSRGGLPTPTPTPEGARAQTPAGPSFDPPTGTPYALPGPSGYAAPPQHAGGAPGQAWGAPAPSQQEGDASGQPWGPPAPTHQLPGDASGQAWGPPAPSQEWGAPASGQNPFHPAQAGASRSPEEAEWMPRAHWLGLLTHWVGPLLVLLTVGARNDRVRAEAVESLNWEITVAIAMAFSAMLLFGGAGIVAALAVVACSIVFHLRGAAEARKGRHYRYPLALRIVR